MDRQKVAPPVQAPVTNMVVKEGYIKRKREHAVGYEDRLLHLHGNVLSYTNSKNEVKQHSLLTNCKVSPITTSMHASKKIYSFEIVWPPVASNFNLDSRDDTGLFGELVTENENRIDKPQDPPSQTGLRVVALALGGVVVGSLTAGVGLLAGLVVVGIGAAAGGGAVAYNRMQTPNNKPDTLIIACDTVEDAKAWLMAIKSQIDDLISQRNASDATATKVPSSVDILEIENWIASTKWTADSIADGFRLFSLPDEEGTKYRTSLLGSLLSDSYSPAPCKKITMAVNASPSQVYNSIREFPRACCSGIVKSLRVVEVIDRFTDVIYLSLNEMYVAPTWTAPRDFCLLRFAKQNADGSFAICLDSTAHAECPLVDGHIRAELHAVYLVAPPRHGEMEADGTMIYLESMVTLIAQMDPRGWIWRSYGYQENMLKQFLMHLIDIRDFIDEERFVLISMENATSTLGDKGTLADDKKSKSTETIANVPPPTLPPIFWKEPDASTFRLRSKTYNADKFKCNSAPNLFKLVAIDVFEVPDNIQHIAMHPKNRVFQSLQREEGVWVFVVNIMVPGPPFYNFVAYMTGDKKLLEEDTPFGRIAKPFFFGNDDEFRRNRFKLIPKIIEGNMVIKMAVKDTPTLLGNKIKNYYYKGENYFELDVDAGSSSVARNIIGLAIGYAKTIVVDMGFCLQGNEEDELPEVIMGCCRCVNVDMSVATKLE